MSQTPIIPPGESGSEAALREASRALAAGRLIAFPTDTFYALGADPWSGAGMEALYRLKGRPGDKPVLLLIGEADWAWRLWRDPGPCQRELAARFWPGPLTIVAPPGPDSPWPGAPGLALRLPDNPVALALLRTHRSPVTGTSANPHGAPPARTAAEVAGHFPEGLEMILDGGTFPGGPASTIVECGPGGLRVLREGAVGASELRPWFRAGGRGD